MRIEEYMDLIRERESAKEREREGENADGHDDDDSDDEFEPEDGIEDTNFLIDPGFIREVEDENEVDEGERMRRREKRKLLKEVMKAIKVMEENLMLCI
jgi:hypothetical protein